MLLAVDVGNSNIKFGLMDGYKLVAKWQVESGLFIKGQDYADWLFPLLQQEGYDYTAITGVIISTVVPKILEQLQSFSYDYFKIKPMIASHTGVDWGMDINVDMPSSVGSDRLVNAIAAHKGFEGDLIVISLGTATTIDYIDRDGGYNGGLIAPGMALSRDALAAAAAQLPYIELKRPTSDNVIGKNTEGQILIGLYWGYYALVEGLVKRMKKEIASPVKTIVTGGLSILFQAEDKVFDIIDANLTIKGLAILYHRQR